MSFSIGFLTFSLLLLVDNDAVGAILICFFPRKSICIMSVILLLYSVCSYHSPRRRSLIAEYSLSHLTESSVAVGSDNLVQLFSLNPGLVVGLWKVRKHFAF